MRDYYYEDKSVDIFRNLKPCRDNDNRGFVEPLLIALTFLHKKQGRNVDISLIDFKGNGRFALLLVDLDK